MKSERVFPRAGAQPTVVITLAVGTAVTVASTGASEQEQRVLKEQGPDGG